MTELAYPSGLGPRDSGMRLSQLREVLQPAAVYRFRDAAVEGLAFDSREVRAGTVFFAVPGMLDDGARYVEDALDRGAVAVVSERTMNLRVPVLVVDDARRALAVAACAFYDDPSVGLDVVGITGTNGKTTVSHMLRHILQTDGRSAGLLGTIAYEFGGRWRAGADHDPGPDHACRATFARWSERGGARLRDGGVERTRWCRSGCACTRFDGRGCSLNLTQDHLDYHEFDAIDYADGQGAAVRDACSRGAARRCSTPTRRPPRSDVRSGPPGRRRRRR